MGAVVGSGTLTLALVEAEQIAFRIAGSDYSSTPPNPRASPFRMFGPVSVRMAPAGDWTISTPPRQPIVVKGRCVLSVPQPGTYTIRVEMRGRVPVFLPRVQVGEGMKDLGELTLAEGAKIVLRLIKGKAGLPRFLHSTATFQGESPYTVSGSKIEPGDPPTVMITGLGKGRFKLKVFDPNQGPGPPRPPGTGRALLEKEIESDGSTPITIDVQMP